MDDVHIAMKKVRARLMVGLLAVTITKWLILSGILSVFWLLLTKLFPVLGSPTPVVVGLSFLGVVVGSYIAYLNRPSMVVSSLEADRRLGLKERFTSSLELHEMQGAMVDALRRDAQGHLSHLNISRDFPIRPPRTIRWLASVVAVYFLLFVFVPEMDLFGYRAKAEAARAKQETMQARAKQMMEAIEPLRQIKPEERLELTDAAVSEVEKIARAMELGKLGEKQALAKLTNMAKEARDQRNKLAEQTAFPKPALSKSNLNQTKGLASEIQKGNYDKAAEKARELAEELKKKLQDKNLSAEEREKLASEMKELAKKMGAENSMLSEAMQQAAANLELKDLDAAMKAMEKMAMSLDDLASALKQLKQMQLAMEKLGDSCKACSGGKCNLAAFGLGECDGDGSSWGIHGPGRNAWRAGTKEGFGPGMGGGGQGAGGTIGDLPDTEDGFTPTMLPGEITQGKILASIMQRAAPDQDQQTVDGAVEQVIIQTQQSAEEALTKEEIPSGSKDFVREYFGSLEPDTLAGK